MEEHMDKNAGAEINSTASEQKEFDRKIQDDITRKQETAGNEADMQQRKQETAGNEADMRQRGQEAQKANGTEKEMSKKKEKRDKKHGQERTIGTKEVKPGFWNSRGFQNVVCMTGLLMMMISFAVALLFYCSMCTDEELSSYGIDEVIEETMITSRYTDSWLFENTFIDEAVTQAGMAHARALFETDGVFDENKTIELAYVSMLWGEGVSATGITYRIGDLLAWRSANIQTQWLIPPQLDAVLAKKEEDPSAVASWDELIEILMSAMDVEYHATYQQRECVYLEEAFPADGESLYVHAGDLDMLADYTTYLKELLPFVRGMYDKYAKQNGGSSNIGIALVSPSVGLTYCSFEDYTGVRSGSVEEVSAALYEYVSQKEYGVVHHYGAGTILSGKTDISFYEEALCRSIGLHEGDRLYLVLDAQFENEDSLSRMAKWYETIKFVVECVIAGFIIGLILFVTAFVRRTMLEGRDEHQKARLISRWFTVIPLAVIGLMILCAGAWLMVLAYFTDWYWDYYENNSTVGIYVSGGGSILGSVLVMFVIASVTAYCYFELVNRLKKHMIYQKSLLRFLIGLVKKAAKRIWELLKWMLALMNGKVKWAAGYLLFLIVNLIAVLFAVDRSVGLIVLVAIADLLIGAAVLAYFREQDVLRAHMEATVQGSRRKPLTVNQFHGANKKTADLINDLDAGISRAVEKSMKDERMRTELIANVSHDIRTPLTSVINYVDLLKKEPMESENAQKYLSVLDEKSARLKQLTEDLVEASRITSGNISVDEMQLSAAELVQQITAEYEEKFKQKELTLVLHVPEDEEEGKFIGDSRYVWRVLSNLFSNLYKYAMPHTRVYFSMYGTPKPTFCMELKNISEYPLNISPEELTERFVRGDASRGTEGSGLGLSIAQSLMNVMHGSLEIAIDGDLFKVLLNFPVQPR